MPKFRYTVVNNSNQQLQGTISSPDEASARKELGELEFSIVSIEEIPENEATSESTLPVFEFAGLDKNQKRVAGTIQAEDEYNAYKRLLEEYEFEIEYVIPNNLTEAQKEKERKKGAYHLHQQLEEELLATQEKESADEKDLKEFEKKQAVLQQQIDFVLGKVKEMLDKYEQNMSPATKEKIRQRVDKILRIKNSTNLDYIRKTTEDLLHFIQKEEIFLHESEHMADRTNMVVEAKSMMMELKRGKSKSNMSVTDAMRQWREEHIIQNENPPLYYRIFDSIVSPILGITTETEKMLSIKQQIQNVNAQMKHYIVLYFQAPDPEFKNQARAGIKNLWNQRKKLKKELAAEKKRIKMERKASAQLTPVEKLGQQVLSFTGWLLAFYLIYYFLSIYTTSKELGDFTIPGVFYIYRSAFLKYFLATVFLLHSALSLKINFFKRNEVASLVITPVFLLSLIVIYLNF